jgi:carbamoyltransferase
MYTLGINAAFHDSAACLVHDGVVLAAAEEERFSRIKHAKRPVPFTAWELPYAAIDYCLEEAAIRLTDVDHVAYSYEPALFAGCPSITDGHVELPLVSCGKGTAGTTDNSWDPLFYAYVINAPRQLAGGAPLRYQQRLTHCGANAPYVWHYVEHHLAHEASERPRPTVCGATAGFGG